MGRVAFLFPGQGAQSVGMLGNLLTEVAAAQQLFDRAAEVLGYDLAAVCQNGPAQRLDATDVAQPAIFVASLAALASLQERAPERVAECSAAAGLSLGEYTALVFAGAITFEDGLRLVQERGAAMQAAAEQADSGMVSVIGLERPAVEELCQQSRGTDILQVANLLCPGNIVVSGHKSACARLMQQAEAAGTRTVALSVAGAFHTPLMQPASERLAAALSQTPVSKPRIPVVSNVDAQPHEDPAEIRQLLVRQLVQPVLWEASMRYLLNGGWADFSEIGPGRVLKGLLRRIDRSAACENVGG